MEKVDIETLEVDKKSFFGSLMPSGFFNSLMSPISIYIFACILISLIQILVVYNKVGSKPGLSETCCNICSCMMCILVLYFLGTGMMAWGCATLLILCMCASCVITITGNSLSKYANPSNLIINKFVTNTNNTNNTNNATSEIA